MCFKGDSVSMGEGRVIVVGVAVTQLPLLHVVPVVVRVATPISSAVPAPSGGGRVVASQTGIRLEDRRSRVGVVHDGV